MKADAPALTAEKEALEWATDFFHKWADDLKPGRQGMEDAARGLLLSYLNPLSGAEAEATVPTSRAEAEEEIRNSLLHAWLGRRDMSQYMREFAALLMERGDPLPEGVLRNFIVEFLRNPEKPDLRKSQLVEIVTRPHTSMDEAKALAWFEGIREVNIRKPGRGPGDLSSRDTTIWMAMQHIVQTWGIPATRNDATKGKRECAASIVREALKKGAGLYLGEAAVVKAWSKTRLGNEDLCVLFSDPSETIPPD
jgi:hypothetical protein